MQPWPYPFWIAHRGAGRAAPENTLAAMRHGAHLGYSMFECDVKLSRDGVLFLLHDDTLERTTTGTGLAGAHDWAQLSQLDAGSWLAPQFAGEPPASLAGLASYLLANQLAINLEIKPNPGQAYATGAALAQAVNRLWAGQARLPLLSSFEPLALRGAMETAPHLPRALLLDHLNPHWPALVRDLDCLALVGHFSIFDSDVVTSMREQGLQVLSYTVNDLSIAQQLRKWGLSGLISDCLGPSSESKMAHAT